MGVVCCLVVAALGFNLIASSKMTAIMEEEEEELDQIIGTYNATALPTPSPTLRPTTLAPTVRPTTASSNTSSSTSNNNNHAIDSWGADDSGSNNDAFKPPPTLAANASQAFASRWCDLSHVDWYPIDQRAWQQRAPHFLIPGAKYAGTSELAHLLSQHSLIVEPDRHHELSFFYDANFRRYTDSRDRTKVHAARERMYARDYPATLLQANPNIISLDASPGYLFYSSLLPRRILCVMPWIRLVVIVRNPVDRLLQHYAAARAQGLRRSFRDLLDQEVLLLHEAGWWEARNWTNVVTSDPSTLLTADKQALDVAWYRYQTSSITGALGRSFYDIQLRQWIQALRTVGRDPAKDVYVVRTEDLAADPQVELDGIFDFLHLPRQTIHTEGVLEALKAPAYAIDDELRGQLEALFRPHNRRLKRLLKTYQVPTGGQWLDR